MTSVKNNGGMDGVMDFAPTEYPSHALANTVNQELPVNFVTRPYI